MGLLDVRDLVSEFRTPAGPVRAVDGVDLSVASGEVLCLVGESGCGKTAFGLSVMGLMPDGPLAHPRGEIRFDGNDLLRADTGAWQALRGRRMGMIFQEPMTSLNPVMRVVDQVAEPLRIHGLADRKEARERAVAALAEVGIPTPAAVSKRYPHELSGGMRQRVMIATATIAEPDLLVADEPTTALDVTIEAQIIDLLLEMRERRDMAILFVTHDFGVVAELADRVAVMYAGQIVEEAPVRELFREPRHPYSEGLLASMPRPGRSGRLPSIPGTVPRPGERPHGCRFQDRCPYRIDACSEPIPLRELSTHRRSRCIRAEGVGGAYAVDGGGEQQP